LTLAIANVAVPDAITPEAVTRQIDIANLVGRISPSTLFNESIQILLNPTTGRTFGGVLPGQAEGILATPLALDQSMALIWPHITTLFGLVAVCFGISYVIFMRAEIRA
jgi:ABC-2 type transport system permease protein